MDTSESVTIVIVIVVGCWFVCVSQTFWFVRQREREKESVKIIGKIYICVVVPPLFVEMCARVESCGGRMILKRHAQHRLNDTIERHK